MVLHSNAMTHNTQQAIDHCKEQMIAFAQSLVQIPSVTGNEEAMAKAVFAHMELLGYDQVHQDAMGNVLGTMGHGDTHILFDSHMDTVDVLDSVLWSVPPYSGSIQNGNLCGRGSVDMKGALAVSVYTGYLLKQLGLLEGKTVTISASVMEEDFDGVALDYILDQMDTLPHYAIACEATELAIGYGHQGRALIRITINGVSAHASHPEQGVNPVYGLAQVIGRIETLAQALQDDPLAGTMAITQIEGASASYNSIPQSVSLYIDRRLSLREDLPHLTQEMTQLLQDLDGTWEICNEPGTSWKGMPLSLYTCLPAWAVSTDNPLVQGAQKAARTVLGHETPLVKLPYSTNAVATAGKRNIPTIVLGPGSTACAHMKDEHCPLADLEACCALYIEMVSHL